MLFGASPICARCSKPCYAAEQVMGPGRRIYHKPCLTCTECNKRLDSLQLVEHDKEPYCKPCHMKLFGTRDLRHHNLSPISTPPSPSKPAFSPGAVSPAKGSTPPRLTSPEPQPMETEEPRTPSPELERPIAAASILNDVEASPLPRSKAFSPLYPLPATSPDDAVDPDPVTRNPILRSHTGQLPSPTKLLRPNFTGQLSFTSKPLDPSLTGGTPRSPPPNTGFVRLTSPTTRRPLPLSPTAARTGSSWPLPPAPKPLVSSSTGTSPTKFGGARVECAQCHGPVYFAEQVVAAGQKWHKSCLRCSACSTVLDPGRITEREGTVFCRTCYAKNFGPTGVGYALLGRVG